MLLTLWRLNSIIHYIDDFVKQKMLSNRYWLIIYRGNLGVDKSFLLWYNSVMKHNLPTVVNKLPPFSSFRSPVSNSRYTRQLFTDIMTSRIVEERLFEPPYTLYSDRPGKINFRKEYVRLADPSGFKLASLHLEDFNHWQLLMKAPWFREAKEVWDTELEAKLAAEAMESIRAIAKGDESIAVAVQLSAAKFLATRAYKQPAAKGRPTKADIIREAKDIASSDSDLASDIERISLNKN